MIFNGIDLTPYFRIKDIRGRGLPQRKVNTILVTGMDGEYIDSVETPAKLLEIDIKIISKNLRETIDYLNDILTTDMPVPIIFPDEPDKTYYGIVENSEETGEKVHLGHHDASIYIRRSDPYKYGQELTQEFTQDSAIVENPGTAPAKPIFELTAKQSVTFAMVSDGERYNMIGRPADEEEIVVEEKTLIFEDDGRDLNLWQTSSTEFIDPINNQIVAGEMGYDGTGFIAADYGEGNYGHGPAIIRELSNPIQDFEIESVIDTRTLYFEENFRVEFYMFDEHMNMLGKFGINDNSKFLHRRKGLARVGTEEDYKYVIGSNNYQYDNLGRESAFFLRASREGNEYTFYIAQLKQGVHVNTLTRRFIDIEHNWVGKLKYVQIYIRTFADRRLPNRARMNYIRVSEINELTTDQTPYIAQVGDIFTFDHINNELLLNGEDVKRLKDLGNKYFDLPKGFTTLTVLPENAFDTKIRFKPRYR